MDEKTRKRPVYRSAPFRAIAMVLAVVMVGSIALNAAASVAIRRGIDSEAVDEAAKNYLVDNTEYVNKTQFDRAMDRLALLRGYRSVIDEVASVPTLELNTTLQGGNSEFTVAYGNAGVAIAAENYEEALAQIARCLELYESYEVEDETILVDLMLKKACLLVMLEQNDEAIAVLDETLVLVPTAADAYLVKAQIYADLEDMQGLVETLTAYLILNPDDEDVRAVLAQAQFASEDYAAANEQYAQLASGTDTANIAESEYLYGLSNIQLGNFARAEEYLTAAIAKNDAQDGIYYYRGVCRMYRGDYAGAVQDFTTSINLGSLPQLCYYTRGVCGMMVESYGYEKALADINQSLTYTGDDDVTKSVRLQAQTFLNDLEAAAIAAMQEENQQQLEDITGGVTPGKISEIAEEVNQIEEEAQAQEETETQEETQTQEAEENADGGTSDE